MACCICLANEGPPLLIPCGCGCREAAGCVHVASAGYHAGWHACPTCKQGYTGAMELGPAEALWVRLQVRPGEDEHRLCAQNTLAAACSQAGRFAAAVAVVRE